MSRKDYAAIAEIVRSLSNSGAESIPPDVLAESLAGYLATTNPRFDTARFVAACLRS